MNRVRLPLFAAFLHWPAISGAHHGYTAFDTSAEVTLKGVVSDFHFTNPHCVIELDVRDDNGETRTWKAELTSANRLVLKGWNEASIQSGDQLAITGFRAKNGAPSLWVTKVRMADGRELKIDAAN